MNLHKYFSLKRFSTIFTADLKSNFWKMILFVESFWGIMLIILVSFSAFKYSNAAFNNFYYWIIIAGGLIAISTAFNELSKKGANNFILTLPVSRFELLISRTLIFYFGYLALINILLYLVSFAAFGISEYFLDKSIPLYNLISGKILAAHLGYLFLAPMFLYGSAAFRKYNFIKSLLSLSLIIVLIAIASLLAIKLAAGSYWDGFKLDFVSYGKSYTDITDFLAGMQLILKNDYAVSKLSVYETSQSLKAFFDGVKYFFSTPIVPLFFFLLTFLKLKESEG